MVQVSASSSIQETNAALLANYRATQAAANANKTGTPVAAGASGFASELGAIERRDLPAPVASIKATAAPATTQNFNVTAMSEAEKTNVEESCDSPKISRSARMACAEKATEVAYEDDDFGMEDVVDLINPLHHIPLIGTLYRELTGDTIKPEIQVAGSIAFGAITGSIFVSAVSGIASAAIESSTGKEPTIHVADALFGSDTVETGNPLTEDKIVVAGNTGLFDGLFAAQPSEQTSVASAATPTSSPSAGLFDGMFAVSAAEQASMVPSAQATQANVAAPVAAPLAKAAFAASPQMAAIKQASYTKASSARPALQQAKTVDEAKALPDALVQDMMLMALDKYKTAHSTTTSADGSLLVQ